jgi:hypothetical protein
LQAFQPLPIRLLKLVKEFRLRIGELIDALLSRFSRSG